jgi:cell wall-associated NlpC family hydrolase
MRVTLVVGFLALALAAPAAGAGHTRSWAAGSIAAATKAGLFAATPAQFRPDDPLTAGDLSDLLTNLGRHLEAPPADPSAPVTIAKLDAALVDALGLRATAHAFSSGARAAGLNPPGRFGTEVTARMLGLRTDIPVPYDSLERQPQQPATRADAAFSAARILSLGRETENGKPVPGLTPLEAADAGWGVQYIQGLALTFRLPALTSQQQGLLRTAVSLIGYPYVWGGEDEKTEIGFDCSGYVLRVFRGVATIQGRTAAQMATVPRNERIGIKRLEPGDVLFFGNGRRPAQIGHTAIYLGNDWLIESSGQGVSLGLLSWKTKTFAWATDPEG